MDDRRKIQRQRRLKTGKITFNHRSSVVDCTVRNLSDTGACLDVQSSVGIPEKFELLTEDIIRPCAVEWVTAKRIGVSFV